MKKHAVKDGVTDVLTESAKRELQLVCIKIMCMLVALTGNS